MEVIILWIYVMGVFITIKCVFFGVFVAFLYLRGLEKEKSKKSVKFSKKVL